MHTHSHTRTHSHTHHWDDITAVVRVTSNLSHSFKFQALLRKSHYFYKNMSCSCPIKDNISLKLAGPVEANEFLLRNVSSWLGDKWTKRCVLPTELQRGAASDCTFLLDLMPDKGKKKTRASFLTWPHARILNQLLNRSRLFSTTFQHVISLFSLDVGCDVINGAGKSYFTQICVCSFDFNLWFIMKYWTILGIQDVDGSCAKI